ncbi:LacI family DNA-binding transcriptional regulator [uncultured Tateyamaria sp.]|uniref:LacI family DNA-binding transcriptional regulator n=1 Tax=uncultured Tateyamaria sp. TaxID=455651 RepID=UPI0026150683|nr:LacI family DNA-binding transcriptional regulator [uncultured Tateyamaria sp.]
MATIYDVARVSGVSPKTVSRVINGDAAVKKATKEKVNAAIGQLGYVPSTAARAMRSNRSGLVGLITGAISLTPNRSEASGLPDLFIVQGVQKAMEASKKTLLIADTGGQMDRVPELIRTFEEHRVEGILYVADHHQKVTLPPVMGSTKLVLANCYDDVGTAAVLPNDYQGQFSLVTQLIAKGHRRIAYLALSASHDATILRTKGYRDAMGAAGIAADPALYIPSDIVADDAQGEEQLLWDAIERVLSLSEPPTVICFGNDRMAMRAYGILRSRGLALPDDMSIAGYDNYRMITETLYPSLTSVDLPYHAIGIRATQILLDAIGGGTDMPDSPVLVSGQVHHRASVRDIPTPITKLSSIGRTIT